MSIPPGETISPELVLVSPDLRELAFAAQRSAGVATDAYELVALARGSVPPLPRISWFELVTEPEPEPEVPFTLGIAISAARLAGQRCLRRFSRFGNVTADPQ